MTDAVQGPGHVGYRAEASELLKLAAPIIATNCLSFLMNVVDLAMVGHLGRNELAAASLATGFYSFVFFPLNGVAMALDTLLAQSFGAKNYVAYGRWLIIGCLVITVLAIPVMVLMGISGDILIWMEIDAELSRQAGTFVFLLIPGLLPNLYFIALTKYLQSQHILTPAVVIAAVMNVVNILANYLLIYAFGWGLTGAPIATTFSRFIQFFAICGYLFSYSSSHQRTWPKLTVETFTSLQKEQYVEYLKLGLMGYYLCRALSKARSLLTSSLRHGRWIMIALEAWCFDASIFFAAYLGPVALDAHSTLLSMCGFTYMSFPLAISIAVSIRTGNLLGAGNGPEARIASIVAFALTTMVMVGLSVMFLLTRNLLGKIFSDDAEVVATVASMIPIIALFQTFDGCQSSVAGSFRGMGRQTTVAILNFCGLWFFGLGGGVMLTFYIGGGIGISGLWWGLAVGLFITSSTGALLLFYRTDWNSEAELARKRVGIAGEDGKDSGCQRLQDTIPDGMEV